MKRARQLFLQNEIRIFLFCLFVVLSLWPFLARRAFASLAEQFVFLVVVWGGAVVVLFLSRPRRPAVDRDGVGEDR